MARKDRLDELGQTRFDYWSELARYMKRHNNLIPFNDPSSKHQFRAKAETFGSGKFILVALAIVRPEPCIGVGVEVSGPKEYYAALEKDKARIQGEIGYKLLWNQETKVRDIWLYQYVDFFERQEWPGQHEWLCEKLEAFHKVLKPRIEKLL